METPMRKTPLGLQTVLIQLHFSILQITQDLLAALIVAATAFRQVQGTCRTLQ